MIDTIEARFVLSRGQCFSNLCADSLMIYYLVTMEAQNVYANRNRCRNVLGEGPVERLPRVMSAVAGKSN